MRAYNTPLFEQPHALSDVVRYGVAMVIVAAAFAGLALVVGRPRPSPAASDFDSAVMVELPAAASSQAADNGEDHQEVAAAPALPVQQVQHVMAEPKSVDEPRAEARSETREKPPRMPDPAAVLERKAQTEPPAVSPPPSVAQAPLEAGTPVEGADRLGAEGAPHASAQAISLWQKALMRRLEMAKHAHLNASISSGTVKVAFEIDMHGEIHAARIAAGSGSTSLDAAAVALVKDASPVPVPPLGVGDRDMSFIVPIRFRR